MRISIRNLILILTAAGLGGCYVTPPAGSYSIPSESEVAIGNRLPPPPPPSVDPNKPRLPPPPPPPLDSSKPMLPPPPPPAIPQDN